jgi:hypothetical protein
VACHNSRKLPLVAADRVDFEQKGRIQQNWKYSEEWKEAQDSEPERDSGCCSAAIHGSTIDRIGNLYFTVYEKEPFSSSHHLESFASSFAEQAARINRPWMALTAWRKSAANLPERANGPDKWPQWLSSA